MNHSPSEWFSHYKKRHAEKRKQRLKETKERLENLTPNQIYQLENYTVFQILYINDAACNECRFLRGKLEKIPYRSKAIRKIYDALMKRVNAYWEMIYSTTIDKDSLANLFGNIDDYMDEPISELKNAIQKVLEENEVPRRSRADRIITAVERRRNKSTVYYAFVGLPGTEDVPRNAPAPSAEPPRQSSAQIVGTCIRNRRIDTGLTQKQLAVRAGITQSVLSRIESGKGNPTLSLLEEIAAALGTSIDIHLEP